MKPAARSMLTPKGRGVRKRRGCLRGDNACQTSLWVATWPTASGGCDDALAVQRRPSELTGTAERLSQRGSTVIDGPGNRCQRHNASEWRTWYPIFDPYSASTRC